jgi:flagellum-specific peptidoglycan hydrolase FlgJ
MPHDEFLQEAFVAARAAGHVFPEYAACEAALESAWGLSGLAVKGHNLFGQKQSHPPLSGTGTLTMPTREFLHGAWITVQANWVQFDDLKACFAARMELLQRLSQSHPDYRTALVATDGATFITEVSRTWSTDPQRAGKVLSIFDNHHQAFSEMLAA